ncbi:alcohol dehydrogenase [Zavarzinia compransoris]|uniref:Alcohol dehydrogenase n=1 Tax=Zavarzinia compransoris TaxID=1264899 RepID=A0A317EB87_9PROT|nr:zinc-dependent alcohol dehydrogenase family protein [Zavarzinia compransoris]PWR23476.1 alcohol dehydrogenase [Zavarzinia compransoris]
MVSERAGRPLVRCERAPPPLGAGEVRLRVGACGVCRTDLHLVDGELPGRRGPVVPGHEIVGRIAELGPGVTGWALGERVGVPWLASTCGTCRYCRRGRENLCARAAFTGYTVDGGYAEEAVARADALLRIPDRYDDQAAAPLLCAGLIGYRTWAMAGPADHLGIFGFGAAAHLIAQVAVAKGQKVYAFTRPGDRAAQDFARSLGAIWAGGSDQAPPAILDAALIFAPVGDLVPLALSRVDKGGTVVCGGIHMSDIPAFPYEVLWHERVLRSVANLTRADGEAFMALAAEIPLRSSTFAYPLDRANEALGDLRSGRLQGAAVLVP